MRAEQLFRRFKRLVEAIDKKENFPKPSKRPTSSYSATSIPESEPSASTPGRKIADKGKAVVESSQTETVKVITPELRKLLSRAVEVLPRKEVRKKGDGFHA